LIFEWDPHKAGLNEAKHGVRFEEAASALADHLSLTNPDPLHSEEEDRFVTFGMSSRQRVIVVVHTAREGRIRLIGARVATPREVRAYEHNP
jgi:hypothetical protein